MSALRLPLLLWLLSLHALEAGGAPRLLYGAVEAEAAAEYRAGDGRFGPGFVRLVGTAEVAFSETLTAKAVVSPCAGPYSTRPEGVTQCSRNRLVEELALRGFGQGFDFSVGRQIITQGNTEGFVLLDRFNGRDLCRFARLDTQNKLPNWIAQGRVFAGDASVAATFAPLSAESEIPDPGSYCDDGFNAAGRFAALDDPGNDRLDDWAGGLEAAVTRDRWGATLNALSTREDVFVLETLPAPRKTRPRTRWLGGSAAATLGRMVLRGEVAFAPQRAFTLAPAAAGALPGRDMATDGTDGRWNLLAALGLEARTGDWLWALQYFHDRVEGGAALVRRRDASLVSLRTRRTLANERIALDSFAVLDLDFRDAGLHAALSYEIADGTQIRLGGSVYADFGGDAGFLGRYEGRESLYIQLKRAF
ncbi:MAG: hypothetical protein M3Z21_01480 [Pseudomonadota bacterium]|nr:hypothetical protein [Pseudomonadota bacterium]